MFVILFLAPLTSAGLSIHMLEKSIAYTTGSAVVLLCPPPNPGGGRGNMFGIQSSHSPKSLCLSLCYNSVTGKSLHQIDLQPVAQLRCALSSKGASMSTMGERREEGRGFQLGMQHSTVVRYYS